MCNDKGNGVVNGSSLFDSVFYGKGLVALKVACIVITLLPILLYGDYAVNGGSPLYYLLVVPILFMSALVSVVLVSHFESVKPKNILEAPMLRLRLVFTLVVFSVLYLSEKHVDELFAALSMVQFGATAEQASLIGAFIKPFWFLGIGLLIWVLAHAFNGAETLHQFKLGLAMHSLKIKVNARGDYVPEVKFRGSVGLVRPKANCSFPAYYTGVVVCWMLFAFVVQCLSIVEGTMFLSATFGALNLIFMGLFKDLNILRSQKAIYEYIASEQNKLSVEQVGKNEGVTYA